MPDRFDWSAIHRDLEARLTRLGTTIEDDDERARALLRKRTAELAAAPRSARPRSQVARAVVLLAESERYALALECAHEVTRLTRAAVLPGAGAAIIGIVNWRGEFVTAFDLTMLLGLTPAADRAADRESRCLVVLRGEPLLALAADGVAHIAEIDISGLQPAEQTGAKHAELFKGSTADGLVVLDETRLLASLREELKAA